MSLRNWVYIKNVKVPNLKASLRSPSKGSGRGEEKRSEAVMWGVREAPRAPSSRILQLRLCGITTFPSACSYLIATGEAGGQQRPTHSKDLRG